jgi:hypothetical protein
MSPSPFRFMLATVIALALAAQAQSQGLFHRHFHGEHQKATVKKPQAANIQAAPQTAPPAMFIAPPPTGEFAGASAAVAFNGPELTFPELRLALPTLRLPSMTRFRRDAQFNIDAAKAGESYYPAQVFAPTNYAATVAAAQPQVVAAQPSQGQAESSNCNIPCPKLDDCDDREERIRELEEQLRSLRDCLDRVSTLNSQPTDNDTTSIYLGEPHIATGPPSPIADHSTMVRHEDTSPRNQTSYHRVVTPPGRTNNIFTAQAVRIDRLETKIDQLMLLLAEKNEFDGSLANDSMRHNAPPLLTRIPPTDGLPPYQGHRVVRPSSYTESVD